MLDKGIVAVSPSTTYRVLKENGLLGRWRPKGEARKRGFVQPQRPHEHWHIDISYVSVRGVFAFLIAVLDGYSRFIVHHELRAQMTEYDVEVVLQRALEKYPGESPRIISDNGTQFVSRDFRRFMQHRQLKHVRTAPYHPQSNGKIEAFNKTMRRECIRVQSFLDLSDARKKIDESVHHYCYHRLHSAIWYLTPYEVLSGQTRKRLAERDRRLEEARKRRRERARRELDIST
jgi:transposase InsO family protein